MSETDQNVDLLAQRLQETKLPSGVSFAGKGLKLDTADDAQQIVDAINACGTIEYLNLEGNTIGVGAAIAISKALEGQSGLKRALWKDMFTGRLKEEIPKALKALCRGVMKAKAQIEVLDLSDNASGPIGVHGISEFIKSPSCYTLKELRLNNMGLGITGAQMLSNALLECCRKSKEEGNPLKLKVFIAGRNRLEDDGIKSLSRVFRTMKSLEELSIPQNGIYTLGIEELAEALSYNLSLKKLNLNDNTLREGGAKALANSLRNVHDLRSLDIGDCLIKTNGAFAIAEMLAEARNIQEVVLSYNSIKTDGAVAVLEALISNKNILSIKLDGNKFGEQGKNIIRNKAEVIGSSKDILDSLEEDEGSEDDDDDDDDCEEDEEDEEDDEEDDEDDYDEEDESASLYEEDDEEAVELSPDEDDALVKNLGFYREEKPPQAETISAAEFISEPSMENLLALGPNAADRIIEEVKEGDVEEDPPEIFGTPPNEINQIFCNYKLSEKDVYVKCTCDYISPNYDSANGINSIQHFGHRIAEQLKEMEPRQAELAMKLIEDALSLGYQGRLSKSASLVNCGNENVQNNLTNLEKALSNLNI